MRLILVAMLLVLVPGVSGAEVYKCKGRSGESVYSQNPCDATAQPMALRVIQPATPVEAISTPGLPPTEGAAEQAHCVETAGASIYGPSNDRVATYQQQVAALQEQFVASPGNTAIRGQITHLQQAIARERASANAQLSAARTRCAQQHQPAPPVATPQTATDALS